MMTFEIYRRSSKYYYRITVETGHIIMSSDGFSNKEKCLSVIELVKKQFTTNHPVDIKKYSDGTCHFKLTNENELIGHSMLFNSELQYERWMKLMQHYIPASKVIELTSPL